MFLCWTFRSRFSSKVLMRKKKHKNLSVNHLIHVVLESCLVIIIVTLCSKIVLNSNFVDWIIDIFVHVFLQFLVYHLNFESNSCMLFSSQHVLNQFLEVVLLLNFVLFFKFPIWCLWRTWVVVLSYGWICESK